MLEATRRRAARWPGMSVKAAAVAVVAAVGLTACGGSGQDQEQQGPSQAVRLVQAAYQKTVDAGTVAVSFQGSQPQPQSPAASASPSAGQTTVTGEARLDFEAGRSTVTVEAPGAGSSETRTIEGVQYQQVPKEQRQQVPGKKPWVKIDMVEVGKLQYGDRAAEIADAPPLDPAAVLPYLRAVTDAKQAGSEDVGGVATTRYDVTADLQKGASGQGPQLEQQSQQLSQQLGKPGLPMRVWLDEQGQVRRLQATLPGGQPGGQQITVTEDFYGHGEPVSIEAPDGKETADVTEQLIRQQQLQQQMQQQQQQQQQQMPQPQPSTS